MKKTRSNFLPKPLQVWGNGMLLLLLLVSSGSDSQAQTTTRTSTRTTTTTTAAPQNGLPSGFPKFEDTGNLELDNANYTKAKQQWIAENPQAYQRATSGESPAPAVISEEDFNKMSPEKQSIVKANPSLYVVGNAQELKAKPYPISSDDFNRMPAEKQAMIKANPDKYVIQKPIATPNGKTQVRREELESMPAEKQALIKANPNTYEIID